MKKILIFLIILLVFCSCAKHKSGRNKTDIEGNTTISIKENGNQMNVVNINLDSNGYEILKEDNISHDTLKQKFSLEDVGTEGTDGIAYYINRKLQKIEIDIYTSMWKIHLLYFFNKNNIKVTEETFNIYENVELIKTITYLTDFNGVLLGRVDSSRIDIFKDVKKVVPFLLK